MPLSKYIKRVFYPLSCAHASAHEYIASQKSSEFRVFLRSVDENSCAISCAIAMKMAFKIRFLPSFSVNSFPVQNKKNIVFMRFPRKHDVFISGWVEGFEPSVFGTTIRRFNQLSYTHHIQLYETEHLLHSHQGTRLKGFEPLTYCLEGSYSIQLS